MLCIFQHFSRGPNQCTSHGHLCHIFALTLPGWTESIPNSGKQSSLVTRSFRPTHGDPRDISIRGLHMHISELFTRSIPRAQATGTCAVSSLSHYLVGLSSFQTRFNVWKANLAPDAVLPTNPRVNK